MGLTTKVIVCWLFAAWWLAVAARDILIDESPRHGNGLAITLAFIIAGQLAWLGYLFHAGVKGLPLLTLAGLAIAFLLWVKVARR